MLGRRVLLPSIGRGVFSVPNRVAHALIVRELHSWIRLEFLGVVARSGIADALAEPRNTEEILEQTRISDGELLAALLELGVSLRELRERRGRYRIRGRRMRAIAGASADLRGVVEELTVYGNPVYSALESHLHGKAPQPYDADCGDVVAAASRVAEPILGPTLRTISRRLQPRRVLDIGCGSGVYLHHILDAVPNATGLGIDLDESATAGAVEHLRHLQARCQVRQGDIEQLVGELGEFDLVLLLNNIYYWAPADRAGILGTISRVIAPGGTLVVATATPAGQAFNRHLDLVLRVTESSHCLPTKAELKADFHTAGLIDTSVVEPVPMTGLVVATARRG